MDPGEGAKTTTADAMLRAIAYTAPDSPAAMVWMLHPEVVVVLHVGATPDFANELQQQRIFGLPFLTDPTLAPDAWRLMDREGNIIAKGQRDHAP